MLPPASRHEFFLAHHGALAPLAGAPGVPDAVALTTPAGHWIDLGNPPIGMLVLVDGHAVAEVGVRSTSRAHSTAPADIAALVTGKAPERDARVGAPSGRRVRLGVAEVLHLRHEVEFSAIELGRWPAMSVFALSPLTWIWVAAPVPPPRSGTSAYASAREVWNRHLGRAAVRWVGAFPRAARLSWDAARVIGSFAQLRTLEPGGTLVADLADSHAGVLLQGGLAAASAALRPGDLVHEHLFGGETGPNLAPVVSATHSSTVLAFPRVVIRELQALDARLHVGSPRSPCRLVHIVIGDADEARPDGQTMALQTAATMAQESAGPAGGGGVLYVDLAGPAFKLRLPHVISSVLPVLSTLPAFNLDGSEPWRARGVPLALVGIEPGALPDAAAFEALWQLLQPATGPGKFSEVVVRVPRSMSGAATSLYSRAFSISASADSLLEPWPAGVPAAADLCRFRRIGRDDGAPLVMEMTETRFRRDDAATRSFWEGGTPWCLA